MFKRYKDVILGATVILLGVCLFIVSFSIKSIPLNLIKADFFPRLIAGLFILLGAILFVSAVKKSRTISCETNKVPFYKNSGTISMLETLVLIAVYVLLMDSIGFVIMTFVYLMAQMYVLAPKEKRNKKNILLFLIISLISSLGIYLLFVRVFFLMLPAGILPIY